MLDQLTDELHRAAADRDPARFLDLLPRLHAAARTAGEPALTATLARLGDLFERVPVRLGARLGVLCGALAELGGDPEPVAGPLVDELSDCLELAGAFAAYWRSATGGRPPEPVADDHRWTEATADRLTAAPLTRETAVELVGAWSLAHLRTRPVLSILQLSPRLRRALPGRERLIAALGTVLDERADLECLAGLLRVLDDERLIVLHRPAGRGYEVVIGGIGDNSQLRTLLAEALDDPGGLPVRGPFTLADGHGRRVWDEGRPADIPRLDGVRVVVLGPPPYERPWRPSGRYPLMRPSVRLRRVLPAGEAAAWLARVAPEAQVTA
ncbi:hypothetical protein MF672_002310 [Actinomadura sp. ATCC 31491]|uniref:Uncharacterized protein n=1 Tax=Actinomadura luzonensis TaxID=2805427 RepID=A0ABT0FJZ7_9ACTN|nr:hypothetical protein [Actinomadura luzonensis]MCK2212636.1 hypothetical protein [Actinomadura luzonensis]